MTDGYELRRRCEALVASLNLRPGCGVDEIGAAVSARRGRPIQLTPAPITQAGVCGVWIATTSEDLVFYAEDTTAYHRRHIMLHEFGHMLCDHHGVSRGYQDLSRALAPDIDPATIERVLGRDACSDHEEREAELFAALAMRPATMDARLVARHPDGISDVEADMISRISAVMRGTFHRDVP